MGQLILRTNITRQPGTLYYVKSDENGFLGIYSANLSRGGKSPKKIQIKA